MEFIFWELIMFVVSLLLTLVTIPINIFFFDGGLYECIYVGVIVFIGLLIYLTIGYFIYKKAEKEEQEIINKAQSTIKKDYQTLLEEIKDTLLKDYNLHITSFYPLKIKKIKYVNPKLQNKKEMKN